MERNQSEVLSGVYAIPPAVYAADNTPATVDLLGYQAATIYLMPGIGGITFSTTDKIEFVLSESDDNVTFTPVAQADVQGVTVTGAGIVRALVAAHAAASVTEIAYVGRKRYLRLLADFSGTHSPGTPLAALVVRGLPLTAPVA